MNSFYRTFNFAGLGFLSTKNLTQLQKIEHDAADLFSILVQRNGGDVKNIKSQIGQDVFSLFSLNWKRNGFFVEFGATNGVDLSNTFLLEKDFGWKGILAEPAKIWHKDLLLNRSASIDFDCVWSKSGDIINFTSTPEAEFSAITSFKNKDFYSSSRNKGDVYPVKTISLNDLLKRHNAPQKIDYLSVDTEGSELDILEAFDFKYFSVSVITCEHNFSSQRDKIHNTLSAKGFIRIFEGFSRWDDWYINPRNISYE